MKTTNSKWFASVSLTKLSLVATGMFLAATSSALATVRYVNVNNANPEPPYTTRATAATPFSDIGNISPNVTPAPRSEDQFK